MIEAYPLRWPDGWPRTAPYRRESDSRFGGRKRVTMGRAVTQLMDELRLLGATNIIVSSNIPTKSDPGIAVFFDFKQKKLAMARDGFTSPAGNIRSLTLAIEGLRQLERHGGAFMLERAFTGFLAIAPPDWKKPWREVFGVEPDWTGDLTDLYHTKARSRHPDAGGSDKLMAELNVAYDEARRELGSP